MTGEVIWSCTQLISLSWTFPLVLLSPHSAERRYDTVQIVLVGKYVTLQDSYMSVVKSLEHASMRCGKKLELKWVDSSNLEPEAETADPVKYHDAWRAVCSAKGIIVPGGFGHRGTEGMIAAVKWAREKKVPFLGICLGFQIAVIEWARNVCGFTDAHSAELVPETPHPVIVFMPEISKTHLGGTMRLGLRPTLFESNTEKSKLRRLYGGEQIIWERHRHRYEVGPDYVERLEQPGGMRFVGKDERGERMQVLEMDGECSGARWFDYDSKRLSLRYISPQTTHTLSVSRLTPSSALDLSTPRHLSSDSSPPLAV